MIFTKNDLIQIAKKKGIKGYTKLDKDDLYHVLVVSTILPLDLMHVIAKFLGQRDLVQLSLCSFTMYSICEPVLSKLKERHLLKKKWGKSNQFCYISENVAKEHHIPYIGYIDDFFSIGCNCVPVPKDIISLLGIEPLPTKKWLVKSNLSFTFKNNKYGGCCLNPFSVKELYYDEIRYSGQINRTVELIEILLDYYLKIK